jgi:hypothetical protein
MTANVLAAVIMAKNISRTHTMRHKNTSDPYNQECASINASYLHSAVSLDNCHRRVDTSQHVATKVGAVADVAELVADPILYVERQQLDQDEPKVAELQDAD